MKKLIIYPTNANRRTVCTNANCKCNRNGIRIDIKGNKTVGLRTK